MVDVPHRRNKENADRRVFVRSLEMNMRRHFAAMHGQRICSSEQQTLLRGLIRQGMELLEERLDRDHPIIQRWSSRITETPREYRGMA